MISCVGGSNDLLDLTHYALSGIGKRSSVYISVLCLIASPTPTLMKVKTDGLTCFVCEWQVRPKERVFNFIHMHKDSDGQQL